jgi:hypothetical protein
MLSPIWGMMTFVAMVNLIERLSDVPIEPLRKITAALQFSPAIAKSPDHFIIG